MNRIKKWVAMVLAASFVFLLAGCCGPQTPADKGYIEIDGTYCIYNADGLAAWIQAAKSDPSTGCMLLDNITLPAGTELEQVGEYAYEPFVGNFNGNGKTISGLTQPIFGFVGEGGVVANLSLDVNINLKGENGTSYNYIGGVTQQNYGGTISSCTVNGNITVDTYVGCNIGGIAGINTKNGVMKSCVSRVNITAITSDTEANVGGIVGYNNIFGTIKNCTATGKLSATSTKTSNIGGIAGTGYGAITDCSNKTDAAEEIGNS